jgi:hypothetical protein
VLFDKEIKKRSQPPLGLAQTALVNSRWGASNATQEDCLDSVRKHLLQRRTCRAVLPSLIVFLCRFSCQLRLVRLCAWLTL